MLEIILSIAAIGVIAKIADSENLSAVLWGSLALLILIPCVLFIPIPFGRVLIGAIVAFVAMLAYNARKGA